MIKKIALFAMWMAALSLFVYRMAYADCSMADGDGKAKCAMAAKASCPKCNFVPGNKKAK